MKQMNFIRIAFAGICISALAGCAQTASDRPQTQAENNSTADTSGSKREEDLIDSADLIGDVTSFSDSSCSVIQAEQTEGGAALQTPADGYEDEASAVTVNYNAGCQFLVAVLNTQSGEIVNVTNGSVSDVKKQSQIYVYGGFVDTHSINADKVIVTHFE